MGSKLTRRLGTIVLFGMVILGVILSVRTGRGLDWWDKVGSIGGFLIAIGILVVPRLRWAVSQLRGAAPLTDVIATQAKDDLAVALRRQMTSEERLRRINDPYPLPLQWKVTARRGGPHEDVDRAAEIGEFGDILPFFNRVATRRLVILGPVGAGKSVLAVRLVRDLLEEREPGGQVPVIVAVGTWKPGADLGEWIAEQLVRAYPGFGVQVKRTTGEVMTLAQALVDDRGVLPVLDGLDEVSEPVRAEALAEINAYGSDVPLVLTSRPQEYSDAVVGAERGVSCATVIELLPLQVEEVKAYLSAVAAGDAAARWEAVFKALETDPECPLAQVLPNPLMLWLTRSIYERRQTDPSELVDAARALDRRAIESHLVDTFVPSVYADCGSRRRSHQRSSYRYRPRQAQRWLSFLAGYLDRTDTQDLGWWRLASVWRVLAALRS